MSDSVSYVWHRIINPMSVLRARMNGEFAVSIEEWTARFTADSFWEPLSVYHTVKKERRPLRSFLSAIEPDSVVYDIGANVGVFSAFAVQAATAGQVIGIEPHPTVASRAAANVALNGDRGRIEQLALADKSGSADLSTGVVSFHHSGHEEYLLGISQ